MREEVEGFLVELSEKFAAGDVDGVQADLSLPAVIYFGSDMILLSDRESVAAFTEAYHDGLKQQGLHKARLALGEMTIAENGTITAMAVARMLKEDGTPVALGRTRYFIRQVDGTLKVEMAEHGQVPLEADLIHGSLGAISV